MKLNLTKGVVALATCIASLGATPAFAAATVPSCSAVTFSVATLGCSGFFGGNLIANGGPKLTQALDITDSLNPNATSLVEVFKPASDGSAIDFAKLLSGQTVVGIHFGGGRSGYNGTAFWLLDLPSNTDTITWSSTVQSGISSTGLYYTGKPGASLPPPPAVPEPSVWAMMLAGFGFIGFAMRKSRKGPARRVTFA
jgi:hypothetical protein